MDISQLRQWFRKAVAHSEPGQGLVEYGLIMMLVALVVVTAVSALGGSLANMYNIVVNVFR